MGQPQQTALEHIDRVQSDISRVRAAIGTVVVGQAELIDNVLLAIACGGHVLLEGVPGLGKTLLVRTLGHVLDLTFSRIQFTPDLMPADILGANILVQNEDGLRSFRFQSGPIFAQLILADEINRTTPKTQAALLEAMQEHRVTLAGQEHRLPEPFFVLATQNPIEMEGTYPLPEAQIDRFFFKLKVLPPSIDELRTIVERTTGIPGEQPRRVLNGSRLLELQSFVRSVPVSSLVQEYALRLVMATQPDYPTAPEAVRQYVRYGASPRGAQALLLAAKARALFAGRYNVALEDIRSAVHPALRHRLILNFEAEASGVDSDAILSAILDTVVKEGSPS